MMIFKCIVVLYNKKIPDSSTLNSLKGIQDKHIEVHIFDNSDKNMGNSKYVERTGWFYYTKGENIGISKAYNYVIDRNKDFSTLTYFVMLDDDAEISGDFFKYLERELRVSKLDISVPIIKVGKEIMSPSKVSALGRVKKINDLKEVNQDNITAINNGMVINSEVFNTIRYNDKLFIDYVDHDFMRQARGNGFSIGTLHFILNHNMSSEDTSISEESRLFRFNLYVSDLLTYFSSNDKHNLFGRIQILHMGFRYFLRYRNGKFLKIAIKRSNQ